MEHLNHRKRPLQGTQYLHFQYVIQAGPGRGGSLPSLDQLLNKLHLV